MNVDRPTRQNVIPSTQSHTPGPWAVNGDGCLVALLRGGTDITAPCQSVFHAVTDEELAANAHLIAAVPALYAIALVIDSDVALGEPCPMCSKAPHRSDCSLVAAIDAAEGR